MTRAEAMKRHPAKDGTDSVEKILILLELTKLSNELQAQADSCADKDLAYHCLAQGAVNGVDAAMRAIKNMEAS